MSGCIPGAEDTEVNKTETLLPQSLRTRERRERDEILNTHINIVRLKLSTILKKKKMGL